jgi:hypothetical protein
LRKLTPVRSFLSVWLRTDGGPEPTVGPKLCRQFIVDGSEALIKAISHLRPAHADPAVRGLQHGLALQHGSSRLRYLNSDRNVAAALDNIFSDVVVTLSITLLGGAGIYQSDRGESDSRSHLTAPLRLAADLAGSIPWSRLVGRTRIGQQIFCDIYHLK